MGAFDDLIPNSQANTAGAFDDLIPKDAAPEGGFVAAAKQAIGAGIKGAGQVASDYIPGVTSANPVSAYGQSVIDANPTAVTNIGGILESPWQATKEAVGNAAGSMGSMLGARALGTGITAAAPFTGPAAPFVAGAGQLIANVGPFVAAALPSYGGIREEQIKANPLNEADAKSKAIAALGAGTVGAIEGSFGPQAWALAAMKKGGIEEVAKKFADAKSITGAIGKGFVKGAAVEGAEEVVQNPIEQVASYRDPTTKEAISETLFGGAMGALGGGVAGGGISGAAYAISGPLSKAVAAAPGATVPPAVPVSDAGIASAAQFPQFTAPPQPVTGGAPLEQAPTAMPVPQATQNAPAAPGSPSPVSAADPLPSAKQAESAGAPIPPPQGPLPSANQTEVAIPPTQGPEAASLPVAAKPAKGIAAASIPSLYEILDDQSVGESGSVLHSLTSSDIGRRVARTVKAGDPNGDEKLTLLSIAEINRRLKIDSDVDHMRSDALAKTGWSAHRAMSGAELPNNSPGLQYPQQPTTGGAPLAQTPTAMPIGKYGKAPEKAPTTYKGMTVEQMAKVASQHGHAYEDALQKIKANPGRWVNTVAEWRKADIAAKLQERKLKLAESFEPNEKQKKVIALVSDSPTYSKDRDLPMAQHNARSTQTLLARGVLSRIEYGDTVEYRVNGNATPVASRQTPSDAPQQPLSGAGEQQAIASLQSAYNEAKAKLEAIGPEPRKPSTERQAFGDKGKAGAPADEVAKYEASVKAYVSWKAKYNRLKKAEVEASNALFAAKKEEPQPKPRQQPKTLNDAEMAVSDQKATSDLLGYMKAVRDASNLDEARGAWRSSFAGNHAETIAAGDITRSDYEKLGNLIDRGSITSDRAAEMIDSAVTAGILDAKVAEYMKEKSLPTKRPATVNQQADAQHIDGNEVEKATPAVIKEAVSEGAQNAGLDLRQAHAILLQRIDSAIASAPSEKDSGGNAYVAFKISKDTTDSVPNTKAHLVEYRAKMANLGANVPLLEKVDEAIAAAPQVSDAFVVFEVPGDGKFKITNTKERLDLFRKKIASNAAGFRPQPKRQPYKSPLKKKPQAGAASDETIREMLHSGELTAALELSKVVGRPLVFGTPSDPNDPPLVKTHSEPIAIKGFNLSVGRSVRFKKSERALWSVTELESGSFIASGTTKADAEKAAAEYMAQKTPEEVRGIIAEMRKAGKAKSQAELESRWLKWAEEEEYRIDNAEAIQEKADKERVAREKEVTDAWERLTGQKAQQGFLPFSPASNPYSMDERVISSGYMLAVKNGKGDEFLNYAEGLLDADNQWQKRVIDHIGVIRDLAAGGWSYDGLTGSRNMPRGEFEATTDDGREIAASLEVEGGLASGFVREDKVIKAKIGQDASITVKQARAQADKVIAALMKPAKKESEEKPAEPAEKPPVFNTEDAGSELTYNRRNRLTRGLKWDDIADKDEALRVKEVTKAKVYPKPDYQAMIDGGVQPIAAHIVKQVYDSIATKPQTRSSPSDANLQMYIDGVNRVMSGALAWANDRQAMMKWAQSQIRTAGAMLGKATSISDLAKKETRPLVEFVYPDGWRGVRDEVIIVGGNKVLGSLSPGYDEASRATKEIATGWPASQEAWQRQGYKVINRSQVTIREQPQGRGESPSWIIEIDGRYADYLAEKATVEEKFPFEWMVIDKYRNVKGAADTEAKAKESARALASRAAKTPTISDKGINVSAAVRTGADRRMPGEDISSDRLRETFKFKGVNFGNWMKGDANAQERQLHLNHAYDSFMDLAEVLDVPPEAMSLNGMLGVAIGAQGSGGFAAAHFVPGVNEINLTRESGAGSLAHEWAHALDHYFARQAGMARATDPFLTEHRGTAPGAGIRPEIVAKFDAIVQAMRKRSATPQEREAKAKKGISDAEVQIGRWLREPLLDRGLTDDAEVAQAVEKIKAGELGDGAVAVSSRSAVRSAVHDLAMLVKKKSGKKLSVDTMIGVNAQAERAKYLRDNLSGDAAHVPQQMVQTQYLDDAVKLDDAKGGKKYWSTSLEMFARAFDAFVSDELESKAAKNTYLSHAGRTGATVPKGDERTAISAAIKELVDAVETKDGDDGNVILFSFAGQQSATADQFQLDRAKQLLADGANANAVRQQTGWFKNPSDGKWRYEIDDSGASLQNMRMEDGLGMRATSLETILDHPALFAAYPALRDMDVQITIDPDGKEGGSFERGSAGDSKTFGRQPEIKVNARTEAKALSTLLHEIQHGIQNVEGFATGGNPRIISAEIDDLVERKMRLSDYAGMGNESAAQELKKVEKELQSYGYDAYAAYRKLAGEVESRNVQQRQNFPADKRRLSDPLGTQDVAPEDVIVMFNGKDAKDAPAPANTTRASAMAAVGASPADAAVFDMAAEGKSAQEILAFLSKASRRPFNRVLAAALSRIGVASTVSIDPTAGWRNNQGRNGAKFAASYSPKTDTVALYTPREAERHVLHEFVHSATLKAIARGGPAARQMQAIFDYVQRTGTMSDQYGMGNFSRFQNETDAQFKNRALDEFTAELFTNPLFQVRLKQLPAPSGSKLKSAWDWIVRVIANMLGLKTSAQETALDRALSVGAALLQENAALTATQGGKRFSQEQPFSGREVAATPLKPGTKTLMVDGVERPALNSNGKPIHWSEEGVRNFWRWFQNSAVTDGQGRPRVVYHGAKEEFSKFNLEMAEQDVDGIWLTDTGGYASWVASGGPGGKRRGAVMDLYLRAENPMIFDILEEGRSIADQIGEDEPKTSSEAQAIIAGGMGWDTAVSDLVREAKSDGRDALIIKSFNDGYLNDANTTTAYVAFDPNQIKSANANAGAFSPEDPDIRYSLATNWQQSPVAREVSKAFDLASRSDKKLSWLNPVQTQYHKAERLAADGKPLFKRVFDIGQRFLNDISRFAVMAENAAPTLFHQIKSIADVGQAAGAAIKGDFGKQRNADIRAIAAPLYEGTLYGGGNPMAGIAWNESQLRQRFGLTDKQITLYQEARDAVKVSMDEMAKSLIARHAKREKVMVDSSLSLSDVADEVSNALNLRATVFKDDAKAAHDEAMQQVNDLRDAGQDKRADADEKIADAKLESAMKEVERIKETAKDVKVIAEKAYKLQEAGYFPLMRFGRHTVTARDADGKVQHFSMHDGIPLVPRSGQIEANKLADALREEHPDWTVETGLMNPEKYKLYQGMNVDALQLFADHLDDETKQTYQEIIRLATNERSALKRMLKREGTPGFDKDVRRTLASFILSNARYTSSSYHLSDMTKAAESAENDGGDIGAEAVKLVDYITKPQEEAAKIRGFLFFNFLGGSLAAAMVNATQIPMMTFPRLSQYEPATKLAARLARVAKMAMLDPAKVPGDIGYALRRAEEDGITAPHQIYELTGTASNNIFAGSRGANAIMRAWGAPFALAESFNRRATFLASYEIAKAMTPAQLQAAGATDAYEFAAKMIAETQGIYNRGNRVNVGRGALGATVMTFKQFSIMYMEMLSRMPPKQQAIMVGMLLLAAGAGGLPFAEDAEDIIDTIGQWMGYRTNTKRTIRNALTGAIGQTAADVTMNGLLSRIGVDLHSRLGLHNILPGSALLKPSTTDKSREFQDLLGPAASVVASLGQAMQSIAEGKPGRAALTLAPVAIQNAVKGWRMGDTGRAEDMTGKPTIPVSASESVAKGIGFNPQAMADYGAAKRDILQDERLLDVWRERFTADIVQAVVAQDAEALQEARQAVDDWNARHPDGKIAINPASIRRRVAEMRTEGPKRVLKSLTPALRQQARQELYGAQ